MLKTVTNVPHFQLVFSPTVESKGKPHVKFRMKWLINLFNSCLLILILSIAVSSTLSFILRHLPNILPSDPLPAK